MLKLIDNLKSGIVHGVGFCIVLVLFAGGIYLVNGAWQSSNPTSGLGDANNLYTSGDDVLTKEKWNALVEKVSTISNSSLDITCPTAFTKVQSQGKVYGCIQNDVNPAQNFQNAIKDCHDNYGGRLPSYSEVYMAMTNYNLLNEGVSSERIDQGDYYSSGNAGGLIGGTADLRPSTGVYTALVKYRCFIEPK
ncbi:MAG: hypothetical protein V3575_05690 [Candidatus Absconditabacteria bacterium]